MVTRLHPQDLRALMAAIIGSQNYEPYQQPGFETRIVTDVDLLLTELERTAKPDNPNDNARCPTCRTTMWLPPAALQALDANALAPCALCGTHIERIAKLEVPHD